MAQETVTAPETAGAAAQQPLQTVGDAFEALSAAHRESVIGNLVAEMAPKPARAAEPEPETPVGEMPAEVEDQETDVLSQPEAEAEAETEAEAEPEGEPEETREDHGWKKRVDKLTAKLKAAEERAAALEAEKKEAPAAAPQAVPVLPDPMAGDPEVKKHLEAETAATEGIAEANRLLAQASVDPGAVAARLRELQIPVASDDEVAVRQQLEEIRETLRERKLNAKVEVRLAQERAAARHQYAVQQQFQVVAKEYPWLTDPKSPQHQMAVKVIQEQPWLKQLPNPWDAVAAYVEGKMVAQGRKAKPAAKPKPVAIPSPKAAPSSRPREAGMSVADREGALLGGDRTKRLAIIEGLLRKD